MWESYDEDGYDPEDDTFAEDLLDMDEDDDIQETGYDGDGI